GYPLSRTMSHTARSEPGSTSDVGGSTFAMTPSLFARTRCRSRSLSFNGSSGKYMWVICAPWLARQSRQIRGLLDSPEDRVKGAENFARSPLEGLRERPIDCTGYAEGACRDRHPQDVPPRNSSKGFHLVPSC